MHVALVTFVRLHCSTQVPLENAGEKEDNQGNVFVGCSFDVFSYSWWDSDSDSDSDEMRAGRPSHGSRSMLQRRSLWINNEETALANCRTYVLVMNVQETETLDTQRRNCTGKLSKHMDWSRGSV